MNAPVINPVLNALPGMPGAGNGQAAGGALAGFEALLAAFFSETDIAGVPTQGAAAPSPDGSSPPPGPDAEGLTEAAPESTETAAAPDALLNSMLLAQAAPGAPQPAADPAAGSGEPAATAGQARPHVAPAAAPAAHADPQAQPREAAPADPEPSTPQAEAAKPPPAAQVSHAARPPAEAPTAQGPAPRTPHALPAQAAGMAANAAVDAAARAAEPPPMPPGLPAEALAQPSAREEITKAADAAPPPPAPSRKEKKGHAAARGEDGGEPKSEGLAARGAAPGSAQAPAPPAAAGAKAVTGAKAPEVEAVQPEARRMDAPEGLEPGRTEEARSPGSASTASPAAHAARGAPETVANLAAQIVKKLDSRSTRFDLELDPAGLGKVEVRVEIGAHGRVTAAMTFENPQAAADLRSRSGDLHRALEQAGFDLSGGLSFDVASDRGQARHENPQDQGGGFRGRAFQQALETAGEADLAAASGELRLRRGVTGGVDVRI